MKLPQIETITFDPIKGTHILDSKRGAIGLAIEHQCEVEFVHNGKLYGVRYNALVELVVERDL